MAKDKDKKGGAPPPSDPGRSGSVVAEDEQFSLWLNRLWAREEPPERIELWQIFRENVFGEMIHHEDFKAGEKRNVEQINKAANEVMEAAQNDCDSSPRKKSFYLLKIIDRNRKASALVRRIGPLSPKRTYAVARAGSDDLDDDDGPLDAKSLELTRRRLDMDEVRWDKSRYDTVMGQMLVLQNNIIQSQQTALDRMFEKVMTSFDRRQEAEDRSLDRELARNREQWKLDMYQDGIRTARNLMPRIFAEMGKSAKEREQKRAATSGNGGSNGGDGDMCGSSPERTLVDNFLSDVEKDDKLCHALFGVFEEREGQLEQVKPGIFTFEQFAILVNVRGGRVPAKAVDDLLPNSGHENAVTEDQINKALAAGLSMTTALAFKELVDMRMDSKEENAAGANEPETDTPPPPPGA